MARSRWLWVAQLHSGCLLRGIWAAPQPPNRRDWPQHGLECPLQSHMAIPLAASVDEAKMHKRMQGAICHRGDQVPHFGATKDRQVPPAVTRLPNRS